MREYGIVEAVVQELGDSNFGKREEIHKIKKAKDGLIV